MNKILFIALSLILCSCSFDSKECSDKRACEKIIVDKIISNWKVPENNRNYAKVRLIIRLKENGKAHTIQVYKRRKAISPSKSLIAAVKKSSPFIEIQWQLDNEYEDYKKMDLTFYDDRVTKIIHRSGINGNILRSNIDLLDALNDKDIVKLMGEPDIKKQCSDLYQEYECWVYSAKGLGLRRLSYPNDIYFMFYGKKVKSISLNYNDSKPIFAQGMNESDINAHTKSVDAIIAKMGEPNFFGYDKRNGQLFIQYKKGIIRDNTWYPGINFNYQDGRFNGYSLILKDSAKIN